MYSQKGLSRIVSAITSMGIIMILSVCGMWVYNHYKEQTLNADMSQSYKNSVVQGLENLNNQIQ